ncbi:MAG: hypothetical protein JWR75_1592 [Devosia sp.]|nr:hypothetical protein [Devosia sp.]
MAERKSGPVKPPVIDLEARSVPSAQPTVEPVPPEVETAAAVEPPQAPETVEPVEQAPAPPPEMTVEETLRQSPSLSAAESRATPRPVMRSAGGLAVAIAGGALGGALLVYLLALADLLPERSEPAVDYAPALAAQAEQLTALETQLGTLGEAPDTAALETRIAALETAADALPATSTAAPDLTAIETRIADLSAEVAALSTEAAPDETAALTEAVAEADRNLTALADRVATIETASGNFTTEIAALQASLNAAEADLAARAGTPVIEMNAALQMPLLLSGLEAAFANGRPFDTELVSLSALMPDVPIPEPLAASAADGLLAHEAIAAQLNSVVPDILAARPADTNASWQQGTLDWLGGLLALRPVGEIAGDTPDAILSQIVGAVSRRDFAAADALFNRLPAPMRQAAGTLPAAIAAQASATAFLDALRRAGLTVRQEG